MNDQQREVQRRLRVIKHAETLRNVRKTCRYFGLSRSTFYRWKSAYKKEGELGLTNKSTAPKHHPKQLSQGYCQVNRFEGVIRAGRWF